MFTYLLIYLHIYYLLTYTFTYLLTYLLAYLLTYLLAYLFTYIYTYLLTPCSRVILEKLTVSQLVKNFFLIFFILLLISSSSILAFRYSFLLFPKCLLASRLTLFITIYTALLLILYPLHFSLLPLA